MTRTAIFAGSFDPPGLHQRQVAEELARRCDEVVVVPSGVRPDTQAHADSRPVDRAAMVDLAFRGLPRVRVDLDDIERQRFTPNAALAERHKGASGSVTHVVEAAWARGGEKGSRVCRTWDRGPELWRTAHFAVIAEANEPLDPAELPPHHEVIRVPPHLPPAELRSRIFHDEPVAGLLPPRVEGYIRRHGLFRGVPAPRECLFRVPTPRLRCFADEWNPESGVLEKQLDGFRSDDPELIVPIGGDGTMLRAIRTHWRERLPFYGLNTGHLGFLMNDKGRLDFWNEPLVLYQLPLLWVEVEDLNGVKKQSLAFNDTWVERSTGQTAWVEVRINGDARMPKVVCDGMLISTAAGSTAYARAMGAAAVPFNTQVLILAGSNVLMPDYWRPAVLPVESEVELTTLDPVRRPLQCYIDGVSQGMVRTLRARVSNAAAVELAFTRSHDPVAKLARIQFPQR
jgi:NAD kinase/nicotinic acid mononucleotide adenylyltransferase